ncbi:hypothetical protein SEPCBS119000_004565 [Sporothrix epigloea]|uniref:F-box domain-containing protein n=1 Tax=Sporothrix epigloea TaxID=1892477 RepID=A0ABP0DWN8_9PEZI
MAADTAAPGPTEPSPVPRLDRLSLLPTELLLRITNHLTTAELCAVRSCSRTIERSMRHFFLLEYFWRKQFMLTDFSLQTLLAIAQHPLMSQELRHVTIGVEEFSVGSRSYPDNAEHGVNFWTAAAQQKSLFASGRALQLLAAAFSLLPNLETVQLRDFSSRTRSREGPHVAWHSYGLRRTREQLGKTSRSAFRITDDAEFSSRAFALVMSALALSNARPECIEVKMQSKLAGLQYFAFDLTPVPRLSLPGTSAEKGDGDMLAVLAGLSKLFIKLQFVTAPRVASHLESDDSALSGRSKNAAMESLPLRAWLAHCPKVEWFRLNLHKEVLNYNDVFLRRLGSPLPDFYPLPVGSTASRDITMPFASHLLRFDLGVACCRRDVLLKLLDRFPALEHLSLFRFSLVYEWRKEETPYNVWKFFLDALAQSPLGKRLKSMTLIQVGSAVNYRHHQRTQRSHRISWNGQEGIRYIAKSGVTMSAWLRKDLFLTFHRDGFDEEQLIDDESDTPEDWSESMPELMSEDMDINVDTTDEYGPSDEDEEDEDD